MKQYRMLFVFIAIMLAVSLACVGGSSTPTAAPSPTKAAVVPQPPSNNANPPSNSNSGSSASSDLVTFTDENNLLAIDLPGNWTQESGKGDNYYYNTFTSPDKSAKMENIVYNDGTPFVAAQNGKFALGLLHQFYSATGKEGDIKVTKDETLKDGTELLTWESKSGGYSGFSNFELRGSDNKTFLMFTAWWDNKSDQANLDAINAAFSSYRVP